jgi:hypothetical protein
VSRGDLRRVDCELSTLLLTGDSTRHQPGSRARTVARDARRYRRPGARNRYDVNGHGEGRECPDMGDAMTDVNMTFGTTH